MDYKIDVNAEDIQIIMVALCSQILYFNKMIAFNKDNPQSKQFYENLLYEYLSTMQKIPLIKKD